MMRHLVETILRIPPQPEPPPGDEASARVFQASPRLLLYLRVRWAVQTLLMALPVIAAGVVILAILRDGEIPAPFGWTFLALIVSAFLIQAVFRFAVLHLDFERRWYIVTDRRLRIREGVMNVREVTFTFANIQNLEVTQGPVQRVLGISDLKVETAGGGGATQAKQGHKATANLHVAHFHGIGNAEEVKQVIGERMRALRDSGLGDQDDSTGREDRGIDFLEALREVRDEATRLRAVVERC